MELMPWVHEHWLEGLGIEYKQSWSVFTLSKQAPENLETVY